MSLYNKGFIRLKKNVNNDSITNSNIKKVKPWSVIMSNTADEKAFKKRKEDNAKATRFYSIKNKKWIEFGILGGISVIYSSGNKKYISVEKAKFLLDI